MEEGVPSVSVSGVASRFVSQSDVEAARARREEQWKAAYARLGQEPPPQPTDDSFDGRSLAEASGIRYSGSGSSLLTITAAKQEEWEEKMKLGNQFRALEEDEIVFLDSIREKQAEEERLRKVQDGAELSDFRKAVAARENAMNKPPSVTPPSSKPTDNLTGKDKDKFATGPPKRDTRKVLKGVVVKKKSKLPTLPQQDSIVTREDQPEKKRRKIS
ncbi:N-terminal domain of NEFA-interacting nuclear protein NIP30-domain-containing protein [Pisolithus croceorrhizus]|nr:N-terminal domain of NEFA-interacting nuclear protein NIP30-domain-containing protein [Pisolithus croceorrhizus]